MKTQGVRSSLWATVYTVIMQSTASHIYRDRERHAQLTRNVHHSCVFGLFMICAYI